MDGQHNSPAEIYCAEKVDHDQKRLRKAIKWRRAREGISADRRRRSKRQRSACAKSNSSSTVRCDLRGQRPTQSNQIPALRASRDPSLRRIKHDFIFRRYMPLVAEFVNKKECFAPPTATAHESPLGAGAGGQFLGWGGTQAKKGWPAPPRTRCDSRANARNVRSGTSPVELAS